MCKFRVTQTNELIRILPAYRKSSINILKWVNYLQVPTQLLSNKEQQHVATNDFSILFRNFIWTNPSKY